MDIWYIATNSIFKCLKFGHSQKECKHEQICLICSGKHSYKQCDNKDKAPNIISDAIKRNTTFIERDAHSIRLPNKILKMIQLKKQFNRKYRKIHDPILKNLINNLNNKIKNTQKKQITIIGTNCVTFSLKASHQREYFGK